MALLRDKTRSLSEEDILGVVRRCPFFGYLNDSNLHAILQNRTIMHYDKGQLIFLEGDCINSHLVVLRGMARLVKHSPCGRLFTVAILHPTETLTDISIFNTSPVFVSAEAMKPTTTILGIDRMVFLDALQGNSALMSCVMASVGRRVKSILERLMFILADKAERRVCKVILMLTSEYGGVIPFNQHDIADIAGVTRETVSRATAHLQEFGLVRRYRGGLDILDIQRLRSALYCDEDSPGMIEPSKIQPYGRGEPHPTSTVSLCCQL